MTSSRPGRVLAVVAAGAAGLTLCDLFFHTLTDALSHDEPGWFGQAWWVPLVFVAGTVWFLVSALPFARRLPDPEPGSVLTGAAWFVGAYAASGAFHEHPEALALGLLAVWLGRLALTDRPGIVAAYALLLATTGCLAEGAIAATGVFEYAHEDVANVPLWLFTLYLNGAQLALALAGGLSRSGASIRAATSPPTAPKKWPCQETPSSGTSPEISAPP
jgi:hypothetical protein